MAYTVSNKLCKRKVLWFSWIFDESQTFSFNTGEAKLRVFPTFGRNPVNRKTYLSLHINECGNSLLYM